MPKINTLGGKAIDAGGFGCVFKPALKCEGDSIRQPDHVSKLMIKNYAESEMDEISKFLPIITTIPNHSKYFIISNITQCRPDILETSDLDDFDDKCRNLTKKGFSSSNINKNLDKLGMLNIIDGGVSIKNYITKTIDFNENNFHLMNSSLILLLNHGIVEMNKRNLFHCDLKADNILIKITQDGQTPYSRIIDWGLATIFNDINDFSHRPLQFNIPFGSILLSRDFVYFLREELEKYHSASGYPPTDSLYKMIATNWLCKIISKKPGHFEYIKNMIEIVYKDMIQNCEFDIRQNIIIDHLALIIKTFTNLDTLEFDIDTYVREVYSKNIDIFGLIISYIPLIEHLQKPNGKYLNIERDNKLKLLNILYYIFDKYIFDTVYAVTKYSIVDITNKLFSLSHVLGYTINLHSDSLLYDESSSVKNIKHSSNFIPVSNIPFSPIFSSHHRPKRSFRFSTSKKSKSKSKSKFKSKSKSKKTTRK